MIREIVNLDYNISRLSFEFVNNNKFIYDLLERISNSNELKGLISVLIFWVIWFYPYKKSEEVRDKLVTLLWITVLSITIGRFLANMLPFRPRPRANSEIAGSSVSDNSFFEEWSSMPSDHAVMFFAFSAGLFFVSKRASILSFIHTIFIVCIPRVIIGLHYVSDILVGALVGIVITIVTFKFIYNIVINLEKKYTVPNYIFYPSMFFITYSYATMFDGIRDMWVVVKMFMVQMV